MGRKQELFSETIPGERKSGMYMYRKWYMLYISSKCQDLKGNLSSGKNLYTLQN